MNVSKMKMVKLKNAAKQFKTDGNIIDYIVQQVCAIPNYEALKSDPELVRFILELLENGLKGKSKEDQVLMCETVIKRIYPNFSDDDKKVFDKVVIFLLENRLIKSIGCLALSTKLLYRFFFPKK